MRGVTAVDGRRRLGRRLGPPISTLCGLSLLVTHRLNPLPTPLPCFAGLNLVLISRTESKLKDCAAELEAAHGIEARTVAVDLCKATPADYARVAAALEGLEVIGRCGVR